METLAGLSSKIVIGKYRDGRKGSEGFMGKSQSQISFSKCHRRAVGVSFPYLTSLQYKTFLPIVPPASATTHSQASETALDGKDEMSVARVRFLLQKACKYGDHFLIVGDDPLFGSWDPENAIPMKWSDGHVWTAEVDIPIGKTIQFKFIRKKRTGNIVWQPGPDRICKTCTTSKTVTVVEDWKVSEFQKIIEDGVSGHDEKLKNLEDSDRTQDNPLIAIAENINFSEDSALKNANINLLAPEESSYPGKEFTINMMVAHNIASDHGRCKPAEGMEVEEVILTDPILVHGLATMSSDGSQLVKEVTSSDSNGSLSSQEDSKEQTALESCVNLKAESEEESETHKSTEFQLQKEERPDLFSRQENLEGEPTEGKESDSGLKQESLKSDSEIEKKADGSPNIEETVMEISDEPTIENSYLDERECQDTVIWDSYRILKNVMHWGFKTLHNLLVILGLL